MEALLRAMAYGLLSLSTVSAAVAAKEDDMQAQDAATNKQEQATESTPDLRRFLGEGVLDGLTQKILRWTLIGPWPKIGEITWIEVRPSSIRFKGLVWSPPPGVRFDGAVRLHGGGRCTVSLNGRTDDQATYVDEGSSILIESRNLPHKPSARVWRNTSKPRETKIDLWVDMGPLRPKFHVAVAPMPKDDDTEGVDLFDFLDKLE